MPASFLPVSLRVRLRVAEGCTCKRAWRSLTASTISSEFNLRSAMGSIMATWDEPCASASSCTAQLQLATSPELLWAWNLRRWEFCFTGA